MLELLFILGLSSLIELSLLTGTLIRINKDLVISNVNEAYMLCAFARWEAMAQDNDLDLEITPQQTLSLLKNTTVLTSLAFGKGCTAQINGSGKLGFKASGTTQYSGTLSLTVPSLTQQLTLGVGNGKLTLK